MIYFYASIENAESNVKNTEKTYKNSRKYKKCLKKYPGKVILFTISADIISRMEKITTRAAGFIS